MGTGNLENLADGHFLQSLPGSNDRHPHAAISQFNALMYFHPFPCFILKAPGSDLLVDPHPDASAHPRHLPIYIGKRKSGM